MRNYVVLVLVLLAIPGVSAFSVTYTNINNSIFPLETASFAMQIVNTKGFEDTFQVSTRDPNWIITTDPPLTAIPEQSSKRYLLYVKPKQGVGTGPHAVYVKTKSLRSGQFKEDNLLINVKPSTPFGGEYAPAVSMAVNIGDGPIDARKKIPVGIRMSNKNPRDMPDLLVVTESDIFYKEEIIHLNPLEQKTLDVLFDPKPDASPGVHTLTVKLILNNINIAEVRKDFEVLAYSAVEELVTEEKFYFQTTRTYTVINKGNEPEHGVLHVRVPFYKRLFVSLDPDPVKVEMDGRKVYEWRRLLDPGESYEVRMSENYNFLALVIIAGLISLMVYYIFRSPVIIRKEAIMQKGETVKVRLTVKNRSKKKIDDVKIMDKVPSMAQIHKKTDLGTLKPSKIVSSATKGTSMRWELEFLEPYEERIITYKMHCKLKIIGGMSLPTARVRFQTPNEKKRTSYSNNANVVER